MKAITKTLRHAASGLALACGLMSAAPAHAWGDKGHEVVAIIARYYIAA